MCMTFFNRAETEKFDTDVIIDFPTMTKFAAEAVLSERAKLGCYLVRKDKESGYYATISQYNSASEIRHFNYTNHEDLRCGLLARYPTNRLRTIEAKTEHACASTASSSSSTSSSSSSGSLSIPISSTFLKPKL